MTEEGRGIWTGGRLAERGWPGFYALAVGFDHLRGQPKIVLAGLPLGEVKQGRDFAAGHAARPGLGLLRGCFRSIRGVSR